jgi:hypothetical protein
MQQELPFGVAKDELSPTVVPAGQQYVVVVPSDQLSEERWQPAGTNPSPDVHLSFTSLER